MSIFDSIRNAIFGHASSGGSAPTAAAPKPAATTSSAQTGAGAAAAPRPAPSAPAPAAGTPSQPVDVEAVMDGLAKKSGQPSNWRTSIVDLLKLLDLDSSLQHRKALAAELGYRGSTDDSAAMNVWLHKQVMAQLAAHGGKVPATLH